MPEISIRSIFQAVQHGSCDVARLTTDLTKIYNVGPYPVFWEDFCYHLKFSMIVYERQPAVEHTINFVVNFATSLVMKLEENEELVDDDAEGMHPFLAQLLQFLLQSHNANSRAVRFRSCLLINKLLFRLGEEAQIDNELYDVIQDSMLVRLRDICPIVRVQAAFAMARLQDPDLNSSCPIIESFQFHLSHDPSSDVRRAVLLNIAVSRRTLPVILERTRDEKDSVRKLVLEIVAEKVHVKAMTIAQRVKLLQDGLSDRAVAVKKACSSRLVQKWLSVCDDNIVTFLRCLDVENSTETSKLVLESMFSQGEVTELVKDFKLLNDEQVIPVESLSCESVLYWHQLCKHIQSQGTEFIEQLEQLLPTATVYSEYLAKIFDEMKKSTEVEEQLENEFIMDQLLQLAEYLDITDIVGRKSLEKVIKEMILDECTAHTMLKSLLARFKDLYPDQTTRCRLLVEMISDVRQPIVVTTQAVSEDEQRRIDVKLASIRVQINEVKEELTTAVESSEFSKAAELKEQLHELDKQRQELLDTQPAATQSEERQEKNDPLTLLYCLTIASEMLQHLRLTTLTPEIQTLNEVLILPGIQNEDPTVRNMAVRSLGLCCLMDKEIAKSHLLLLTQISQIDQEHIRVSALQFMFDLLLTFGLNVFEVDTECNQDTSLDDSGLISDSSESDDLYDSDDSDFEQRLTQGKQKHKKAKDAAIDPESLNTARSLLNIFVANLNSESCDIRNTVAEGLAKLLLSGWVVSHRLLSRLLLLWYNPITDDDTYLRHCLGTFFTVYAFSSRANQEVVEQSFMLTLQTVLEAPPTSPLAEVDINNVAELLVQLTSEQHQLQPLEGTKEMTCHDNLAMKLASHIISDPRSFGTLTLIKVLNMLTIASTSVSYLKELRVLSRRMMKEVKDKQCVNHLAKFRERIKSLLNDARHGSGNVPTDGDLSQDSQLEMSQVEDTVNETPPRGSAGSLGSAGDVTSTPSLFSSSPRPTATPMPGAGQSPRPVATPMPSLNIGSTSADRLLSTDDSMQVESSELDLTSEVKQEAIDESDVVDSLSSIDIVDSAKKTKRAPKKAAELKSKGARRKSDVLSVPESDDDNEEADPTSDEELVKDVSKKSTRTRAKKTVDNDINSSPRSSRSATTSASQDSVPSKRSSSRRAPSVKEVAKKGKRAPEKRKAATPTTTDQSESDAFITADESQESSTEQLIAESPRTSTRITRAKPKGKKAVTPPKKKAILSKTSTRSKKNLVVGSSESDEESVFTTPSSTSTDSNLAPVEKWSKSRTTRAASAPTKKTLAPEAVKPTRTSTRTTRASRK